MNLTEIKARMAEIAAELEKRSSELTTEEIDALTREVEELEARKAELEATAEKRQSLLAKVAAGKGADVKTVRSFQPENKDVVEDPTNSKEYRTAFMNYICRGVAIPKELRYNTTLEDAAAVIPTTIVEQIIKKLESYGTMYAGFTKLNVQGGVNIPICDLKPTASWVGEGSGTDQKLEAKNSVSFGYYGLEVKISQSILVNVTTIDAFQSLFVELATEAMVKAIEIAAIKGTGSDNAQPLGVANDARVTKDVIMTAAEMGSWSAWHSKVKKLMKPAYRDGVFIMNQSTFDQYIDGMVDQNGQPIGRTNYGIDGAEIYRFMGKNVIVVEDDVLTDFDAANNAEVIAVFMKLSDYVINSNMEMQATKWVDNDNNKIKNKLLMVVDGKIADANGVILVKKNADGTLGELSVTSEAGTASGDTKITVSPALTTGNSYVYKTAANVTAPADGAKCTTGYTAWDGEADITATTGNKILIVEVDKDKRAVKAGIATVTSKA